MANLSTFGLNIYFLLGLLLVLAAGLVVLTLAWMLLRVWLFRRRQQRSLEAYRKRTRRPDGHRYPPVFGGSCDQCGRVSRHIYYCESGPRLCSRCYRHLWRDADPREPASARAVPDDRPPARSAQPL